MVKIKKRTFCTLVLVSILALSLINPVSALRIKDVISCDSAGNDVDNFQVNDDVYCKFTYSLLGDGDSGSDIVDIYVVPDGTYGPGTLIPVGVSNVADVTVTNDSVVKIWEGPLVEGDYDIIVDEDQDGTVGLLDCVDSHLGVGFEVEIPEFTTIAIPAAMILGLVFVMQRRKKE